MTYFYVSCILKHQCKTVKIYETVWKYLSKLMVIMFETDWIFRMLQNHALQMYTIQDYSDYMDYVCRGHLFIYHRKLKSGHNYEVCSYNQEAWSLKVCFGMCKPFWLFFQPVWCNCFMKSTSITVHHLANNIIT